MYLDNLATELLLQIFCSCASITDVLHLASTCHRLHHVYSGSQKLTILARAADAEYGPFDDIIQLITQNTSQPAHHKREAPVSIALIRQVVEVGRVARSWEDIYPLKKWKVDFENRRLLNSEERYLLRRAIYRLWLYSRSFHSWHFPRTSRLMGPVARERAELLHNWSTRELAELEDVRLVIRDVVENNICPSNGTIQRKFRKRYPDNTQPLCFNIHLNYPQHQANCIHASPQKLEDFHFFNSSTYNTYSRANNSTDNSAQATTTSLVSKPNLYGAKLRSDLYRDVGAEGWGDEIPHYYVVEDMLKLDPSQVLWLCQNAPLKGQVESYVQDLGEWFENNGETFGQTLEWVISERGEDVLDLRDAIADGEMGVSKTV